MAEQLNVDAFLDGLFKDKTQKGNFGDRAKRLLMQTKDNQGTCMFFMFPDGKTGQFYTKLPKVMEIKLYNEQFEQDVWHKILPKEFYGELSPEDSKLYDEVVSYYNQCKDYEIFDFNTQRNRTYVLIYGHILKHKNISGADVKDSASSDALLIYPSNCVIDSIGDAMNQKVMSMGGNKEWITAILSNSTEQREAAVCITFSGGQGGYKASVSFEFNSAFNKVASDEEIAKLKDCNEKFKDIIADFLSWQNPTDHKSYFDRDIFKHIKISLLRVLNPDQAPEPETVVNSSAQETQPAHIADQVPAQPSTEAPKAEVNNSPEAPTQQPTAPSLDNKTKAPF
jgi:hypothetical protein